MSSTGSSRKTALWMTRFSCSTTVAKCGSIPAAFAGIAYSSRVKTSKDGVLVNAERVFLRPIWQPFAPDCDKLRLQDVPVHYEYPAKAPEQKKNRKRKRTRALKESI
jgi:hypothetical protein